MNLSEQENQNQNQNLEFTSIHNFFSAFGLFYRDTTNWRLIKRKVFGHINGLDNSFGQLIATNGVLCLICPLRNTKEVFEGHLDFFVVHKDESGGSENEVKASASKRNSLKANQLADELVMKLLGDL